MRKLLLLPCLLVSQSVLANQPIWTDIEQPLQSRQLPTPASSIAKPQRFLKLDLSRLTKLLTDISSNSEEDKYLRLPLPNGQMMQFKVAPTIVMPNELARRYPQIKTWKIINPETRRSTAGLILHQMDFMG